MTTIEEDVERVKAVAEKLGSSFDHVYVVVCDWRGIGVDVYLSEDSARAAVKDVVLARTEGWDPERVSAALVELEDNDGDHWSDNDTMSVHIDHAEVRP